MFSNENNTLKIGGLLLSSTIVPSPFATQLPHHHDPHYRQLTHLYYYALAASFLPLIHPPTNVQQGGHTIWNWLVDLYWLSGYTCFCAVPTAVTANDRWSCFLVFVASISIHLPPKTAYQEVHHAIWFLLLARCRCFWELSSHALHPTHTLSDNTFSVLYKVCPLNSFSLTAITLLICLYCLHSNRCLILLHICDHVRKRTAYSLDAYEIGSNSVQFGLIFFLPQLGCM
jgi:hypothetical protein